MSELLVLFSSASLGVTVTCILLAVLSLFTLLPAENRTYMDPVPGWIRPVWPLVRLVSHFACSNLPPNRWTGWTCACSAPGALYVLTAEDFLALCITMALLFPLLAIPPMASGKSGILWSVVLLTLRRAPPCPSCGSAIQTPRPRHRAQPAGISRIPVHVRRRRPELPWCLAAGRG